MFKLFLLFILLLGSNYAKAQCGSMNLTNAGSIIPNTFYQTVTQLDNQYRTFNATAGCTYTFTFCEGGGSVGYDSQLEIYTDGGTQVAYNDDSYCGLPSHLVWTCPTTGVYRIQHKTYFCNSFGNSATIAYITTCAPTPPCSAIPNAGTATAAVTTFNCSGNPQLNLTGGTTPTGGITYNWESSPTGSAPWTPVPGGTGLSTPAFNVPATITSTTYYRVVTTCATFGSNQSVPVQITVVPASAPVVTSPVNINCGDPASLVAQAVPGGFINWFTTPTGGTPFTAGSPASVSPTTNTTYYAEKYFPVTAINTTGGAVVEHNAQNGDDRSGIAVSSQYLYVVGDNNTARFNKIDLTGGTSLPRRDGIFSDVISERVYSLSNGSTPHDNNLGGTINAIVELDASLNPIGTPISLSQSFTFGSYIYGGQNIIAPGAGFLIFYTSGTIYRVNLTTGAVTNMGAASLTVPYAENWSTWGWSEYDGVDYHLYYLTNSNTIVKRNLTNGAQTTIQSFTNMSDMACMAYNMSTNRFYFHYEGSGQFGGTSETAGYVGAVSSNNCGYGVRTPVVVNVTPPSVTVSTTPTTICLGEPTTTTFTGTPNSTVTYNINGGSNQTLTLNGAGTFTITENPTANTTYNLVSVVSGACSGAMTGSSSVVVNPRPNGQLISNTLTVCKDQPASIGYSLAPTIVPITLNYTDGTNNYTETITTNGQIITVPSNVPGTYNFSITSISNQFNCAGIAGTDYPTTSTASVLVNDRPTANITSAAPGICPGGNTDVTITFTGTQPFFFEYTDGTTPTSPTPNTTTTYTFNVSPTTTTTYSMTNLADGTGCVATQADMSGTATVEAWIATAITTQPQSTTACHGVGTSLTVGAAGSNLTYQWFEGANPLTNTAPYSGADAATLNISSVNGLNNGIYTVVVNGSCGGPITSDPATLTENFNNVWTGSVSTDWSNSSNWACGIVPTSVTNAVIPDMPNDPIVDVQTAECYDLMVDPNVIVGFNGTNNMLSVYGDIMNNGTLDGTGGTGGTVVLTGDAQTVSGTVILDNLTVTNGDVKTLNTDVVVEGILDLDNGMIQLGANDLILSQPVAQIGGGPASFVITDGTGTVVARNMGVGGNPDAVRFHVGINASSYTPIELENLGTVDTFNVRVMQHVYEDGTGVNTTQVDNPVVDRTWMVNENTAGGSIVNMTPMWNSPVDEINGFDQTHTYVAHYWNNEWISYVDSALAAPAAVAGPFPNMWMTTQDSIENFSPFTVASSGQFPLSIRLSSIVAANVDTRNKVQWTSAKEDAGDMYELESSADGRKFTKIATVAAKGEASTYVQWDENPVQGVNYYRVKLLNNDGTYNYSKIVTATVNGKDGFSIEAYPNPVKNMVSVKVDGVVAANAKVVVTDVTGKVVKAATSVKNNGAEINVSDLASGVYLLNYSDDTRNESIKITKQ